MEILEFLQTMYGNCNHGIVTITTLPNKHNEHLPVSNLSSAAERITALGKTSNTYISSGLRRKDITPAERGSAEDVICVCSIMADFDCSGDAHKQVSLPQSKGQIVEFIHGLKYQPTILVDSGNGMQGHWLFESPFYINNSSDLTYIKEIVSGFGSHICGEGLKHGWRFDNVFDIARMYRAPGTTNFKHGQQRSCNVVEVTNHRYTLSTLEQYKISVPTYEDVPNIDPDYIGKAERVFSNCPYMKHCLDAAENLPEPDWFNMTATISLTSDGEVMVHKASESYSRYTFEETEARRIRAMKQRKPPTCAYIQNHYGSHCPEGGCEVKAPISFAVLSMDERLQKLMTANISADDALSDKTLILMAYAKEKRPAEYARFKLQIKKSGISLRDFERSVKCKSDERNVPPFDVYPGDLVFDDLDLHGATVPSDWVASLEHGIQKIIHSNGIQTPVTVCPSPVVITQRMENVDSSLERVELTFYRNGRWKSIVAPRSSVFNRTSIVKYADSGLTVTSDTASDLIRYLAEYESTNDKCIGVVRSIDRLGWFGKEFYPFSTKQEIVFEADTSDAANIVSALHTNGDYALWLEVATKARQNPISRLMIATSFASPLLEPLQHRVLIIHIWHDSRGGKTAVLKLSISIWGDPIKLLSSYNSTAVGLERTSGMLKHIPLGLDELQSLNERRQTIEGIIYMLGNGMGRIRGAKQGGLQNVSTWRNTIISTGEMPVVRENAMDGVSTRTLEIYGKPVNETEFAREIHQTSECNYGFAGEQYIRYLIAKVLPDKGRLHKEFVLMRNELKAKFTDLGIGDVGAHLDNVAVICLGDYYASLSVFSVEQEKAWEEALSLGLNTLQISKSLEREDTIERAWNFSGTHHHFI